MTAASSGQTCPICRKPTEHKFRPFCSRRCADVDLHRWLSGSYVVPGRDEDDEEEPSIVPSAMPTRPR